MDTRFRVYYLVTFNRMWWTKGWNEGQTPYNENMEALRSMVPDLKLSSPNSQCRVAGGYYNRKVSCLKEDEDMLVNALKTLEPKGVEWVKVDQEKYKELHAERNRKAYKRVKELEEWSKARRV